MERPAQPDRYEPLPPLLQIPGHLIRKLSPRGKRVALVLLAAFVVALAVGIPTLVAAKHRDSAAASRAAARANAARIAALRAEIRPLEGRGTRARGLVGTPALIARRALVRDLSTAVAADAAARARSRQFAQTPLRVECSRFPAGTHGEDPAADLSSGRGRYACLAVTAEITPGTATVGGAIGYPYRALVHFPSGRYTFCKVSGRPGEQAITAKVDVPVPVACGGTP
jgi:hypothetical protein